MYYSSQFRFFFNFRYDLITLYYENYDKTAIAAFCASMATLAREGDELCKWIFESAGGLLAKHVQAVYNLADEVRTPYGFTYELKIFK